jgi:hypothetical protein
MMISRLESVPCNIIGRVLPNRTCAIALRTITVDQGTPVNLSLRRGPFRKFNLSHFNPPPV